MFFHIQIFLKQTRRSIKKLVLQVVISCVTVAFFVMSLNLYANSIQNLQTVEDAYTTIATAEFYGYVNEAGDLVESDDESCVGYHLLSVADYDLSPLQALTSVKSIDLRTRVGAYIPGHIQVQRTMENNPVYPSDYKELSSTYNVIRFVLDVEESLTFALQNNGLKYYEFPIRILEQSNPLLEYPDEYSLCIPLFQADDIARFSDDIRRLNRSDHTDSITLYPGVEYVMAAAGGYFWSKDPTTGKYVWREDFDSYQEGRFHVGIGLNIAGFHYYASRNLCYDSQRGLTITEVPYPPVGPFALHRYEDVKHDLNWAEYVQAGEYNDGSFPVVMTNDISLLPAWHQGGMYLNAGRMITAKEYENGDKVCMISASMADYQGWNVGDTLDLHLYEYSAFYDTSKDLLFDDYFLHPSYLKESGGFFEADEYEIVGIFGRRELTDLGDTAEEVFFNPLNAIYIPANAAPNAPEGPIQSSLITIELQNGSIPEFKAAVEELGLTERNTGKYQIKFSYFDQGYDKIKPGLDEMNRNALLLLALSGLLLLVTMVLMAFLFAQQHKHSAGILRMLGGSKRQAFVAILVCAAVVVAIGGVVGTIVGGA